MLISFLSVCVASMVAVGMSNAIALGWIRDMTEEDNRALGAVAAHSSSESLVALALVGLQALTGEEAANIGARLQTYADSLFLMKGYVESIYENPSAFVPTPVKNYLDIPKGELALHWFLEPGADAAGTNDEAALSASGLLEETHLFGNAGMDNIAYAQTVLKMEPGDTLYIYTDGVTEAMDAKSALWGNERLKDVVERYSSLPLRELTVSVKEEIDAFASGAEQADNITMLALRYAKGGQCV